MTEHGHCEQLIAEISEYVEGTLSPDICSELERHLNGCENCRVVVDTLRKTIELYRGSDDLSQPLPVAVRERLFACLNIQEYLKDQS